MATYAGLDVSSPSTIRGPVAITGRDAIPSTSTGVAEDVPASLSNLVPESGSELSPDSTFAFTITSISVAQLVQVSFLFSGTEQPEIAYQNGAFLGRYKGVSDSYPVVGGTRFVFGRAGRWPSGSVIPQVTVVDSQGVVRYL